MASYASSSGWNNNAHLPVPGAVPGAFHSKVLSFCHSSLSIVGITIQFFIEEAEFHKA